MTAHLGHWKVQIPVGQDSRNSQGTLPGRLLARVPRSLSRQAPGLPSSLRRWADRLGARVREVLDLPSRSELVQTMTRLDELDRRLEQLTANQLRDLGEQVASIQDRQEAGAQAVQELTADHDKLLSLRRELKRELKATGQKLGKKDKKGRKPEINVGSPKAMKERKQAKERAKRKNRDKSAD